MVTSVTPVTRLKGMFRFGFFTSPAAKVMLFQASDENNEPTIATPIAAINAHPLNTLPSNAIGSQK